MTKCKYVYPCANKSCTNRVKCNKNANKSGYCQEHDSVKGDDGFGISTDYNKNILEPRVGRFKEGGCGTDWLGMKINYGCKN